MIKWSNKLYLSMFKVSYKSWTQSAKETISKDLSLWLWIYSYASHLNIAAQTVLKIKQQHSSYFHLTSTSLTSLGIHLLKHFRNTIKISPRDYEFISSMVTSWTTFLNERLLLFHHSARNKKIKTFQMSATSNVCYKTFVDGHPC